MRVHLTDTMLRGFMLLAIKEGWDEAEIDRRIKQFAIATELNNGETLSPEKVLEIARRIRAKHRRDNFKVVGEPDDEGF